MNSPTQSLILLVTCSRDLTRRDFAVEVMKNLANKIPESGLENSFIVFDNASKYKDHIQYAPKGAVIVESDENSGYWSALKWVLDNRKRLFQKDFLYLYIIESDMVHHDLVAIKECEDFLSKHPEASSVRTQEFSVSNRWRFDKRLKFLPFHVASAEIHLKNVINLQKAWFKKSAGKIYVSNLHPKLPGLTRLSSLDVVFDNLTRRSDFLEANYFEEMMKLHPYIGIYDGGLFKFLFTREDEGVVSGSYSTQEELKKIGYQQTRTSKILPLLSDLKISVAS
jgi:hypothetical protein